MSNINDLSDLYRKYLRITAEIDLMIKNLDREAEKINQYYEPRNIFNRWRNSEDGQQWKQVQYEKQNHKCAQCDFIAPTPKHLEIDHIKPISRYPQLAINTKNLQLLCRPCNQSKAAQLT